jgi:hypothetical protein
MLVERTVGFVSLSRERFVDLVLSRCGPQHDEKYDRDLHGRGKP